MNKSIRIIDRNNPVTEPQKNKIAIEFMNAHVKCAKLNWIDLDKDTAIYVIDCLMRNNILGAIQDLEDCGFEFTQEERKKAYNYQFNK